MSFHFPSCFTQISNVTIFGLLYRMYDKMISRTGLRLRKYPSYVEEVGIIVFYIVLFHLEMVLSSNVIRFYSTRQIEEFLESLVPTKGHSLFWLLNYNGLLKNTHHYGPSDPVGSFCGIAGKQLTLITCCPVNTVERRLVFISFQFQACYFGEALVQGFTYSFALVYLLSGKFYLRNYQEAVIGTVEIEYGGSLEFSSHQNRSTRRRYVLNWSWAHSERRSVCFRMIWCLRLGLFFKG